MGSRLCSRNIRSTSLSLGVDQAGDADFALRDEDARILWRRGRRITACRDSATCSCGLNHGDAHPEVIRASLFESQFPNNVWSEVR